MFLSEKTREPCCLISARGKVHIRTNYPKQQITHLFFPKILLSSLLFGAIYITQDWKITIDLAKEHLHCASPSFSFLETLLMQSELYKNAESLLSQKYHIFLCFAVEAGMLTLEIKPAWLSLLPVS